VALDLGGTNFRVLLVELKGRRDQRPSVSSKVFLIPLKIMLGTAQMVIRHLPHSIVQAQVQVQVEQKYCETGASTPLTGGGKCLLEKSWGKVKK